VIADARAILRPRCPPRRCAAPITPDQVRMAARVALSQIEPALTKLPEGSSARRDHRRSARAALMRTMTLAMAANAALTRFLPLQLDRLRDVVERSQG